jgi:hypothetical protein
MVYEGGSMNLETLFEAQDYLTIMKHGDQKKIVDIDALSKKHTMKEIITFLQEYLREKEKALRNLILIDRFNRRVDETVVVMFRLSMAIRTLENDYRTINIPVGKEAKHIVQSEQGTKKGSRIFERNSRCHRSPRKWKNSHNDGKDRDTGQRIQRVA